MAPRPRRNRDSKLARVITWVGVASILHVLFIGALYPIWPALTATDAHADVRPVSLVLIEPEVPEVPEEPEPEIDFDGQLVDMPEPREQERPTDADYLAEHNRTVEEETRTQKYRINPEVLAPEYSPDDKLEMENLVDLGATDPSTGAQIGNDRYDPDRHGTMASLPSPFQLTNKDGLQKPVPASHATQNISGAPNNDLLDEEVGRSVNLNTKEFLYAGYLNQIRRLVNFYWNQNLQNLGHVRLAKSQYETVVHVVLNPDGGLNRIELIVTCGSDPLDNAVIEAFRIAGPFPPPPEGLIGKEGLADIGNMSFTVVPGQARAAYQGIDPRAGVQFPGILKSPR